MTTTPPTTGKAKAKAKSVANKEQKKKGKQREKDRKNNNNYVKLDGLITKDIMKDITISPGSSARMT